MSQLKYTLYSDGASNIVLKPILDWLLRQYLPQSAINGDWADLRLLRNPPPRSNIPERIKWSVKLYPCELLFIHRDAEGYLPDQRISEINEAVQTAINNNYISSTLPVISIVPVRMLEAWFLFDIPAIRRAAGNPSGSQLIALPTFNTLENLPDPKAILHNLLRVASGLSGRRLASFNPHLTFHRIPSFIDDFGRLHGLSAFQKLENDIRQIIPSLNLI